MKIQESRLRFKLGNQMGEGPSIILLDSDRIAKNLDLRTEFGEVVLIGRFQERHDAEGQPQLLVSMGNDAPLTTDDYRKAGGLLGRWLRNHQIREVNLPTQENLELENHGNLQGFLEGLQLGAFSFDEFKSKSSFGTTTVFLKGSGADILESSSRKAIAIAESVNYTRSVAQQPPNIINPATLADEAEALASSADLSCTRLTEADLLEMGAGAICAVGQGSPTPSEMLILEHHGNGSKANQPPIVVVGKAITFDTGGYSLKKLYGMASMKYDKSGGSAVLGIMKGVAELNPAQRVIGIIAAAENMVSGEAYRPNDIIQSLSGKTIEIISTDAEGRLVLADALTYACRTFNPAAIVDLATLTGGVVTALGSVRAGLFSTDQNLANALMKSGDRTHEKLWQLPLDDEYFELVRGKDSDLVNSYHHPAGVIVPASSIMGGMFLRQFVEGPYPWAHIDIAATATTKKDNAYSPRGATGFGVRLILDFIENYQ